MWRMQQTHGTGPLREYWDVELQDRICVRLVRVLAEVRYDAVALDVPTVRLPNALKSDVPETSDAH